MTKIRLRFSKSGALCYIGHLDFLKVFQQTIRRAKLPVAYSQGFNPHMLLSFALPLPLGMASTSDYADLTLEHEMPYDELVSQFNAHAPRGLRLTTAWEFSGPGAAALVTAADYMFIMEMPDSVNKDMYATQEKADEIVQALLNRENIVIPKKTKSGIKDTDIRPDLMDIYVPGVGKSGNYKSFDFAAIPFNASILMRLAAGSGRFLNPLIVANLILGHDTDPSTIVRHELYHHANDKELTPLYETPIH